MSRQYSPKRFLRHVPNALLKQYFASKNVLTDIDFSSLSETAIEPIYSTYLTLEDEIRKSIEQDFQQIDAMSTKGGSKTILDEADWHGEDLSEQFASLKGFYEHAFWTFLERPQYWAGATAFYHADTIPDSYWRKRKNLPNKSACVDDASICLLEVGIGQYFNTREARGKNCKVEVYRRNELVYFFAYPEDYAQASIEWENDILNRRPHHPAFEIIFVYSKKDHTLDVYLSSDRKAAHDLQGIFADAILKSELPEDEKDDRIYDLTPFSRRAFQFVYGPELGIESIEIKKLRLKIYGVNIKITLEVDTNSDKNSLYDSLDSLTSRFSNLHYHFMQVRIRVTFAQNAAKTKKRHIDFNITWPNSCTLKYDEPSLMIRKILADSGIEPKPPEIIPEPIEESST